ncbi:MAG: TolC family protein [Planctomycetes bacterium]|nr:TolC family protein [Planctomycetota bacterium]
MKNRRRLAAVREAPDDRNLRRLMGLGGGFRVPALGACLLVLATPGCHQAILDRTDRSVYRLIEDRQKDALGTTSDVSLGPASDQLDDKRRMYSFNPRPVDPQLPEAFRAPAEPRAAEPDASSAPQTGPSVAAGDTTPGDRTDGNAGVAQEAHAQTPAASAGATPGGTASDIQSPSIFTEAERPHVETMGLHAALAYANRHARRLQDAKEDLHLAALGLTLERHLWTPQFVASVQAEYANYGQVRDFDHAMSAVSEVGVTQRLPFGGEVGARVINTLMRDLGAHVTSGETGQAILDANIPLFRGAGRVAYESRYQAERNLIYAVRTYEHFRRAFLVEVAADYLRLQQAKAAIANTHKSYLSRHQDWEKADFINRMGQSRTIFEAPRAKSSLRQAEAQLVSSKEQYASSLDAFKVLLGMPIDALLDVVDQDEDEESKALDLLLARVDQTTAVEVALRYRLDLLNTADAADDRKRGVVIARNRLLPDLNATGSVTLDTDPAQKNSASYNTERATWRGALELRLDDRKTERNAFREAIIDLRKGERDYELTADNVRAEVRRAVRRIAQQENLRAIQMLNVEENELRVAAARAQFDLGKSTNQDVVDAENDLLAARNQLAAAVAAYRNAILEFRRDTGTLRIADDGSWETP